MTAGAPDLRPTATTDSAATMETGPDHQLEHQMPELEPLAKVLPAGGPLVSTWWTCTACGHSQRGGPPSSCQAMSRPASCPLNHPPL